MADQSEHRSQVTAFASQDLPVARSYPSRISAELAVLVAPESETAQTMRSIAAQIQHLHLDMGVRTCCFISDEPQAGTTVIAANVAAALAASGRRTLLIETNFSTPRLTSMFDLAAGHPGLSDWLAGIGDTRIWSGYMQPAATNLFVMTAGAAIAEGRDLLGTHFRFGLTELARIFEIVICDAAPASDIGGTLGVVSAVEKVFAVARANQTRINNMFALQKLIQQSGGALGGTVYFDPASG